MECRVLACDRVVFTGKAKAVYARGVEGWFGVLPNHAPAVFSLVDAPLRVETEAQEHLFHVKVGVLHVHRTGVIVVADEVTEGA